MPYLIKRAAHPEIVVTDGVFSVPVVDPGVWAEWRTILGVPDPGYIVVSDKLWASLVSFPGSAPPPPPPPPPVRQWCPVCDVPPSSPPVTSSASRSTR